MYEFRLYKHVKDVITNRPNLVEGKDYINLLFIDFPNGTPDIGYTWFTTKAVAGTTSMEYILKHDQGWGNIDFDFVLKYREGVASEIKEHIFDEKSFKQYAKQYANDFRWIEV